MKSLLISPVKTEHLSIPNTKVYPKEVQFRQVSLYYIQWIIFLIIWHQWQYGALITYQLRVRVIHRISTDRHSFWGMSYAHHLRLHAEFEMKISNKLPNCWLFFISNKRMFFLWQFRRCWSRTQFSPLGSWIT